MFLPCPSQLLFHADCLFDAQFSPRHPQLHDLWANAKSLLAQPGLCLATQTLIFLGGEFRYSISELSVVWIYCTLLPGVVAAVVAAKKMYGGILCLVSTFTLGWSLI